MLTSTLRPSVVNGNPPGRRGGYAAGAVVATHPLHTGSVRRLSVSARLAAVVILTLAMAPRASAAGAVKTSQPNPSSAPPVDTAEYTLCPVDLKQGNGGPAGSAVACSESLMDPHEVSDIFGRRISNTYLVVEVKVRNLNSDYEYLLHDIRLGYGDTAVTSRDEKLVRGVAEKGQQLDARNTFIRGLESAGSIGGSLSTFSFASVALKNALNVFQGPFTTAVKGFLPDFTVNQMNRLDDSGFTVQSTVVPKQSVARMVVFLSKRVFLTPAQRERMNLKWHGKGKMGEDNLMAIQKNLVVEIAGAHVSEVNTDQPAAAKVEPKAANANDQNVTLTVLGKNLDRVAKARIGEKGGDSAEGQVQRVDSDPTWAKVTLSSPPKMAGNYHIYLETATGQDVDTGQVFTVNH